MKVLDKDFHQRKHLFDGDVDYEKHFGEMTLNIPAILSSYAVWDFTKKPKEFSKKIRKCFIDSFYKSFREYKQFRKKSTESCVLVIGMPLKLTECLVKCGFQHMITVGSNIKDFSEINNYQCT